MKIADSLRVGVFMIVCLAAGCGKGSTFADSVEVDGVRWRLFVPRLNDGADLPQSSLEAGCSVSVGGADTPSKSHAIKLTSDTTARFAIRPDEKSFKVQPGERFRVEAWVRPESDFKVHSGTPGVFLRATLWGYSQRYNGGHIYIGIGGVSLSDPRQLPLIALPSTWSKISAVIEVPPGVDEMQLFAFCGYSSGSVNFDRPKITKVGPESPVTPLINKAQRGMD